MRVHIQVEPVECTRSLPQKYEAKRHVGRGVDATLFSPEHRDRDPQDKTFVLGYTGRLSVEKKLPYSQPSTGSAPTRGLSGFRFLGQGSEEPWLRRNLPGAEFAGVLPGAALARAYANMDLFLFPPHTDTFGNVVLEALASGVPAIVTPDGGPSSIIRYGETGLIVDDQNFSEAVGTLLINTCHLSRMRKEARAQALKSTWDSVFEKIYCTYAGIVENGPSGFAGWERA